MATENKYFTTTLKAGEDLRTLRYHAIALDDCKLANTAEEASGILLNKPNTDEFLTLGYGGEMTFAAGAAISAGVKLTVTTSGWFTGADSNDVVVGENKVTVTSGSLGTGLFFFPQQSNNAPEMLRVDITPVATLISGVAVGIVTKTVAATPGAAHAISQSAVSSGVSGSFLLWGKGIGRMDPAHCCSLGDNLSTTTSGYFTIANSGMGGNATALANIGSAATGDIIFWGNTDRALA